MAETEKIVIEGAPSETVTVNVAAPAPNLTPIPSAISPDVLAILAHMSAENQRNLLTAVTEMRRPSEEEQERLDAKRARDANNKRINRTAIIAKEREDKARQAMCSHSKQSGLTAFVGQVNSDGCWRAFCPLCHYTSRPIRAQDWQINGEGLQLHKMRGLTIPMLEAMADKSGPPLVIRAVPIGMTPDLSDAA